MKSPTRIPKHLAVILEKFEDSDISVLNSLSYLDKISVFVYGDIIPDYRFKGNVEILTEKETTIKFLDWYLIRFWFT